MQNIQEKKISGNLLEISHFVIYVGRPSPSKVQTSYLMPPSKMDDFQIGPDGFLLKVSWTASQLKQHQGSLQAGGLLLVRGHKLLG